MLSILSISLSLLSFWSIGIEAVRNCPIQGPDFPAPQTLPSNAAIQAAVANLTAVIDTAIKTSILNPNTSFSVEIFSTHNSDALFQYFHTSLTPSPGVKVVDSHSVYRIGSVSKVFTVLAFLIEAGDVYFNEPVTSFVPELRNASLLCDAGIDPVDCVDWNSVTIGNLASQLGGIGRDYSTGGELTLQEPAGFDFSPFGLEPLNSSDIPPCGLTPLCNRTQFFAGFTKRHPTYAPSTTPTYSNVAFQILSYALEGITKKSFQQTFDEKIVQRLNLTDTSFTKPNNSKGAIPGSAVDSGWSADIGDETPAGGIYSSSADMSIFGRAILSSTILPGSVIRRWLKPVAFTSDMNTAVGAPWEIFRLQLSQSRVVDMYTKNGGIGTYVTEFVLVPDWDIGFIVFTADTPKQPSSNSVLLENLIVANFFPAVEVAARQEATANFAGHYVSRTPGLNSSLIITTDPTELGLGLTSWISNGTDVIPVYGSILGGTQQPDIRLYPTNLKTVTATNGDIEIAWRAVVDNPAAVTVDGLFSSACYSWAGVDGVTYGGIALDEFLFTIAKNGTVVSVEPRVARAVLQKV